MRIKGLCFFVVLLCCSHFVRAQQDDDTIQYVHGLPVTGEEPSQRDPQPGDSTLNNSVRVNRGQLPRALTKALDKDPLFKSWEQNVIRYDKQTKLYWLYMKNEEITRVYGLSEDGSIVSTTEQSSSAQ